MTRFRITVFPNVYAYTQDPREVTPDGLAELIRTTSELSKRRLPLLKLATFGEEPSPDGSLRHDGNIERVTGVEIDYDGEVVAFDDAVGRLIGAGVLAIAYTSASHRPQAPRWRALLPFATPKPKEERRGWALRAGEILGVELKADSLSASLSYYFGRVRGAEDFRIETVAEDPIDARCEPVEEDRPEKIEIVGERRSCTELTDYGRAALTSAAREIMSAPNGQQGYTIHREAYTIGQLAAAGGVPMQMALEVLIGAANQIRSHDPANPWRRGQGERKVRRTFARGFAKPRPSIEDDEREWARSQAHWAEHAHEFDVA